MHVMDEEDGENAHVSVGLVGTRQITVGMRPEGAGEYDEDTTDRQHANTEQIECAPASVPVDAP